MRTASLLCLLASLLLPTSLRAAAPGQAQEAAVLLEPLHRIDGPGLAHLLVKNGMLAGEWQESVKAVSARYSDWEKDKAGGDMGQYLNDRLIIVALSAAGGEPEKVRKGLAWLALYKEFGQQQPTIVRTFLQEHQGSMSRLLQNFSWEQAADYIKNRRWREDIAEQKRCLAKSAAPAVASAPKKAEAPLAPVAPMKTVSAVERALLPATGAAATSVASLEWSDLAGPEPEPIPLSSE